MARKYWPFLTEGETRPSFNFGSSGDIRIRSRTVGWAPFQARSLPGRESGAEAAWHHFVVTLDSSLQYRQRPQRGRGGGHESKARSAFGCGTPKPPRSFPTRCEAPVGSLLGVCRPTGEKSVR